MGQISSALKICGDGVKRRGRNRSNVCLEADTQSDVPPPQDAMDATHTSIKACESTTNVPRDPSTAKTPQDSNTTNVLQGSDIAKVPPQRDDLAHTLPQRNRSITRKTLRERSEPKSSDEGLSSVCRTRMIKAVSVESVQTILLDFPTEIILGVAQHLPPSGLVSLSYSCRNLRNRMEVSIEHTLGRKNRTLELSDLALNVNLPSTMFHDEGGLSWSLPTMVCNKYQSERLKLLCMLDRDQMISPSKAVCSSCVDTHDRSLFSNESLAQPSRERRCLGSAGRLWMCPHWKFDHNLITTSAIPLADHACGNRGVHMFSLRSNITRPTVVWPITELRANDDAPSKKLVEDVLRQIDTSVCKHLRYNDAFVLSLYSSNCIKLRWVANAKPPIPYCRCSSCSWPCSQPYLARCANVISGAKCELCATEIFFRIKENRHGGETLDLVVRRHVEKFRGCTDRAWIEQVTDPAGVEQLDRSWYKATNDAGARPLLEDSWMMDPSKMTYRPVEADGADLFRFSRSWRDSRGKRH